MRDRRVNIENITIHKERRFVLEIIPNVSYIHVNPTCQRTSTQTHIFFECYHVETYVNTVN